MYRVLLVEDDPHIREMICDHFHEKSKSTLFVDTAENGQEGVEKAYENAYDVLILDVMLPELDGFEICREVRRNSDVPIIFLTARVAEEDMLRGYALGCDDYVTKPFPLPVLYEKVNALIKRSKGLVRSGLLTAGGITVNPNNGKVFSDDEEVKLTAREYSILKMLLESKGAVVSRETILVKLWGYDTDFDDRVLDNHIRNLRKVLGDNGKLIKTVVRRGYRIEDKNGKEAQKTASKTYHKNLSHPDRGMAGDLLRLFRTCLLFGEGQGVPECADRLFHVAKEYRTVCHESCAVYRLCPYNYNCQWSFKRRVNFGCFI